MGTEPSLRRNGRMVVVVGPSGAGKDTLMAYAAGRLQGCDDVCFVRRVITRASGAGGEDHEGVTDADFDMLETSGRFVVSWNAHGLKYGIPTETLDHLSRGGMVIANGSRSALGRFKEAFPALTVINVTARPEVLAARLEARGRETREEILKRLERSTLAVIGDYDVVTIDNSGPLEQAGEALVAALAACRRKQAS